MTELVESSAGAAVVCVALVDLFLTVFNYDGFTFIAGRWQRILWRLARAASPALPDRARHAALSLGSTAMLPATVALWLGLEITGFAPVFHGRLHAHGFTTSHHTDHGWGTAMYFSAGAITTLAFGDIVATTPAYRAAADLEAMVGLATFTLALGYVVTTFSVLSDLDGLHNTVRHHAKNPTKPSSVLARHYRGERLEELPDLLQVLSERLESYDEGLRRYPVVYFFHTRRVERSVPRVFWTLGELLALTRWGLPPDDPMTEDPWLLALIEQYATTLRRLQRSFVGPHPLHPADALPPDAFRRDYGRQLGEEVPAEGRSVPRFTQLQAEARRAIGAAPPPDADLTAATSGTPIGFSSATSGT